MTDGTQNMLIFSTTPFWIESKAPLQAQRNSYNE